MRHETLRDYCAFVLLVPARTRTKQAENGQFQASEQIVFEATITLISNRGRAPDKAELVQAECTSSSDSDCDGKADNRRR